MVLVHRVVIKQPYNSTTERFSGHKKLFLYKLFICKTNIPICLNKRTARKAWCVWRQNSKINWECPLEQYHPCSNTRQHRTFCCWRFAAPDLEQLLEELFFKLALRHLPWGLQWKPESEQGRRAGVLIHFNMQLLKDICCLSSLCPRSHCWIFSVS